MKHKFADEIFNFVLAGINRLPPGSSVQEKIVSKATSAHISQSDEFPYHLVDYALRTSKSEILLRAAETNEDLFAYVFTKIDDAGNAIQNSNEVIGSLFEKLPIEKILKSLPRV